MRQLIVVGLLLFGWQYIMKEMGNTNQFGGKAKFEIKTATDIE